MRDHPSSEGVLDRLKRIRAVYPSWAREFVPGHINGLQLKHVRGHRTWRTTRTTTGKLSSLLSVTSFPRPGRALLRRRNYIHETSGISTILLRAVA
jgi:hypothetical protein